MATAPSNPSPTQEHSPRAAVEGSATTSSPSRRRGGGAGGTSPWTQIVRGGGDLESTISSSSPTASGSVPPSPPLSGVSQEQIMATPSDRSQPKAASTVTAAASIPSPSEYGAAEAQPDGSENGSGGNNASKKPVWNKLNGGTEVGPVMGAVSWPALSESTRASPKSSSDSLKTFSDASAPVSAPQTIQGSGMASPSLHKQGTNNNATTSSTSNHASYNRQRSMKHNSGKASNSVSANGGFSQLPSPRGSGGEVVPNNSGKHGNSGSDSSRDNTHRDGGQRGGFGSQSHSGNEHQQQRNSFRRGNGGPHLRGDGSHHHGYVGRRNDQDRANQDWNPNRGFGGRDTHMQPQRVPSRPFMRGPPPPTPAPFIAPPIPVRPFGPPVVYHDVHSPVFYVPGPHPESVRAVPLIPPVAPMFFTLPDPQLHTKIVNQIEYYFSNENLIKDTFLRQNMDDQGWVPIKLIASFKKVAELTDNIQLILDTVRSSTTVEVEGEKVRRRNDWKRWIMQATVQYSTISSPQFIQNSSEDKLSANLQSVTLDDKIPKHGYGETYLSPSSSGEWSSHSQQSSSEKTSHVAVQGGFTTSTVNTSK